MDKLKTNLYRKKEAVFKKKLTKMQVTIKFLNKLI